MFFLFVEEKDNKIFEVCREVLEGINYNKIKTDGKKIMIIKSEKTLMGKILVFFVICIILFFLEWIIEEK